MSYENPYAPPASDPRIHLEKKDSEVTVELDGYRYGKELLVNKHFISPPYCAKLGIPTDTPLSRSSDSLFINHLSSSPSASSFSFSLS